MMQRTDPPARNPKPLPVPGVSARFADALVEGVTIQHPDQCDRCARRLVGTAMCVAFPLGIPVSILSGEHDHRRRFPGDHGIRFTPKPADHPDLG